MSLPLVYSYGMTVLSGFFVLKDTRSSMEIRAQR